MNNPGLPHDITNLTASGHPYPIRIGVRSRRFIQGVLFYIAFINEATSKYVQTPGAMQEMRSAFEKYGYSDETWETSWGCMEEYIEAFSDPASRHAMIAMKSHWDWYVTHIGKFIRFGNAYTGDPPISPPMTEELAMIGFKSIGKQLDILRKTTQLNFEIPHNQIECLSEMTLVRNLGIHSQWEVDATYHKWSKNRTFTLGQQRVFTSEELNEWYRILAGLIDKTSAIISDKYATAPEYLDI